MSTITTAAASRLGPELQRRLSTNVRMLMARDGINQTQLGERIEMDQRNVSARLRGTSRWSAEDIARLAILFDVHPGHFYTDPKEFRPTLERTPPRPPETPNATTIWSARTGQQVRPAA